MKKFLAAAAVATAITASSAVTFAAANPFEDVPADHWAYDAVAQLAADGVIEGYGDGTYRGDQEITRYEMAQMVARAMAKGGVNDADKAMIDKLAAEFADELNNLGVRVAALEKKVDNVKWKGEIRYTFASRQTENTAHNNKNSAELRLKPSFSVNDHWNGYAGIYYSGEKNNLKSAENSNSVALKWAYAEGVYGNTVIDLGRLSHYTNVDEGMVFDDYVSGARMTFGKDLKLAVTAGRVNTDPWFGEKIGEKTDPATGKLKDKTRSFTSSYQGAELTYAPGKLSAGVGYHHFANDEGWKSESFYKDSKDKRYGDDDLNIWVGSLGYRFDDNARLFGAYAKNTEGNVQSGQREAYNIEFDYKGSNKNKPGSYGIQAGYRHLGAYASLAPTYDYSDQNTRGWYIGGDVVLAKNIDLYLGYFDGNNINAGEDFKILFSCIKFFF